MKSADNSCEDLTIKGVIMLKYKNINPSIGNYKRFNGTLSGLFCLFCFLFFVTTSLSPAIALAQDAEVKQENSTAPTKPVEDPIPDKIQEQSHEETIVMDVAWNNRNQELALVVEELENIRKNMPDTIKSLEGTLKATQMDYQRLYALSQLSRSHPSQLSAIEQQLSSLKRNLTARMSSIELIDSGLAQRQEEFAMMKKDLQAHLTAEKSADLNKSMGEYLATLNQTSKSLASIRARLALALDPAKNLQSKLDVAIKQLGEQLPGLWQSFYLTPSSTLFDLELWQNSIGQVTNWSNAATLVMSIELPKSIQNWGTFLLRFAFIWLPCIAMVGYLRYRRKKKNEGELNRHYQTIFSFGLPLLVTGMAICFASWSNNGGVYQSLFLLGNLVWLWGVMSLGWSLRSLELALDNTKSPLTPLFVPATCGIILLFLNPPPLTLSLSWLLILALLLLYRVRTKKVTELPLFEKIILDISPYVCVASMLISITGWGRLAIPLFLLSLATSVSLQFGVAMTRLIAGKANAIPKEGFGAILHAIVLGLGAPLIWMFSLIGMLPWLTALPGSIYILKQGMELNLNIGSVSFNFFRIIGLLFLFYLANSAVIVGKSFLHNLPYKMPRMERGVIVPLQTALTYAVWGIFGLVTLNALGMSLTSLTVIAGGLSVGLGFGLQTVFNNFISGIILIFGRSLLEGDTIQIGETWGTVRKVSIRSTMVETFDNATIFVPNSEFISQRLTNWTRNNNTIRREVNLGVAYGSNIDLVQELLIKAAKEHKRVMKYPEPSVLFQNFGASSLDFSLRFWVDDLNFAGSACSDIRWTIERLFRENSIEIPFPQLDVHTRSDDNKEKEVTPE